MIIRDNSCLKKKKELIVLLSSNVSGTKILSLRVCFSQKVAAIYLYYVANLTPFCFKGLQNYQKRRINFGFTTFMPYLCTRFYLPFIN